MPIVAEHSNNGRDSGFAQSYFGFQSNEDVVNGVNWLLEIGATEFDLLSFA
jgi:hypothetical protein